MISTEVENGHVALYFSHEEISLKASFPSQLVKTLSSNVLYSHHTITAATREHTSHIYH